MCLFPHFLTAECTPEEAFSIVGENTIFASGSPFSDVDLGISLQIVSFVNIFLYVSFKGNLQL